MVSSWIKILQWLNINMTYSWWHSQRRCYRRAPLWWIIIYFLWRDLPLHTSHWQMDICRKNVISKRWSCTHCTPHHWKYLPLLNLYYKINKKKSTLLIVKAPRILKKIEHFAQLCFLLCTVDCSTVHLWILYIALDCFRDNLEYKGPLSNLELNRKCDY